MISFFNYYGSKRNLARKYPKPRHPHIIEPFAGSASYSIEYPDLDITLVEKNMDIAWIWEYLITVSEDEFVSLPDIKPGQPFSELDCDPRAIPLIKRRIYQGKSGGEYPPPYAFKHTGTRNDNWSQRVRDKLAPQLSRIRHWKIIQGDYSLAPDVEATWFIDPPYQSFNVNNRTYKNLGALDYKALGDFVKSRKGQVIACDRVDATWLPFKPFVEAVTGMNRKGKKSPEAIWTND